MNRENPKFDSRAKAVGSGTKGGGRRIILIWIAAFLIAGGVFLVYPHIMKSNEAPAEDSREVVSEPEEEAQEEIPVLHVKVESDTEEIPVLQVKVESDTENMSDVPQESDQADREEEERQRQMELIIENAASLADSGNYHGALTVLSAAPQEWQETESFRNAAFRYSSAWEADVLTKAKGLADNGKFAEAISLLTEVHEELPESTALNVMITDYTQKNTEALKTKAMSTAQEQANGNMYIDAIVTLRQALLAIGEDNEISQAILTYENAYAASIAVTPQAPPVSGAQDNENPNQNAQKPVPGTDVDVIGGTSFDKAVSILAEDINHASFSTEKQVAWYKVTTSANHSLYRFEMRNNSINTATYITVYNEYQQELGKGSAEQGKYGYVDLALESETTYWIKFSRYSDNRMGNYQFSVLERICDAGNSRRNAYTVETDTQYVKVLDAAEINDWYKFTVGGNHSSYRLKFQNNSINTTVYFSLYDEYEAKIGEGHAEQGKSSYIDIPPAPNKQYHLKVSRYSGDRLGYYQFNIMEKPCDAGVSRSDAVSLEIPQVQHGSFDTTYNEWYMVTIPESGNWNFTFTNNSVDTTAYMSVYDIYELRLYYDDCTMNKSVTFTSNFEKNTTLYICLTRYNNDRLGKYTLTIGK